MGWLDNKKPTTDKGVWAQYYGSAGDIDNRAQKLQSAYGQYEGNEYFEGLYNPELYNSRSVGDWWAQTAAGKVDPAFRSWEGQSQYAAMRELFGDDPSKIPQELWGVLGAATTYKPGSSSWGEITTALDPTLGSQAARLSGSDSFKPSNIGSALGDAVDHYGKALEAQNQLFNPLAYGGKNDWKQNKDKLDFQAFAANKDWTTGHPGAKATAEQSLDAGFDPMENLEGISAKVGSIAGGIGGVIPGAIAGGAAGWGLGSQFGEDADYKRAYNAAGIGAGSGVVSGYLSGNDGGSSGAAAGSEGQLMGDVAALKGAEAGITAGANAGGYAGAVNGYTPWEELVATGQEYASDPSGYAQSNTTDYINDRYLGGYGDNAMAGEMGLKDWIGLAGDAVDMYGQYQAAGQAQDAMRQGMAVNQAAADYATNAYNPYMRAGIQGLGGLQSMGSYDPTTDPQYQMQMEEMARRMNMRSAAMGMGRTSADLQSRAAMGAGIYGDAWNRELGMNQMLTGLGQYGATGAANAQIGQGNTAGNYLTGIGNLQGQQTAGMYSGIGDLLAEPAKRQQEQQDYQMMANYVAAMNRG